MYEELYAENRGLLYTVAQRYAAACKSDRAVSVEDLAQAGFFGLVKASQTYDPARGSWPNYAGWFIAREIHNALNLRDGKPTKAHTGALSLDAPLNPDDPESLTGADVLEDTSLPETDEALNLENMRQYVRRAVERLQREQWRLVMRLCGLEGKSYREAAQIMGLSYERIRQIREKALESLRKDKALIEDARADIADIEARTPYYARVTVAAFQATNTSATEKAVLWRMNQGARLQRRRDQLEQIEQALTEKEALYREKTGEIGKGGAVC